MVRALLDEHEEGEHSAGGAEQADGDRGAPAVGLCPGESVYEEEETGGRGERAPEVVARAAVGAALAHLAQRRRRDDHGDGHVDEQGPPP